MGRKILAEFPGTSGSLGCAISEAVETAVSTPGYRYVLGSVLNQVMLHQSIIGLESKIALDKYGVKPDIIIGCAGGGSNLGGLIAPFIFPPHRSGLGGGGRDGGAVDLHHFPPEGLLLIGRRRRQQFRRPHRPLHGRKTPWRSRLPFHRRRACVLPLLHQGEIRLRLLRCISPLWNFS